MPPEPVVHIVDDDDAVRDALSILLEVEGLAVRAYPSAHAFLGDLPPLGDSGCVITDVHMRGMTGVQLLRLLRARDMGLPVIVITGRSSAGLTGEALEAGAVAVLEKPFGPTEILSAVRAALAVA